MSFLLLRLCLLFQVKGVKDSMPDGSTSMMSMSGISMSDIDSNYDTMSISGGRVPCKSGSVSSNIDYGRQKKKYVYSSARDGQDVIVMP